MTAPSVLAPPMGRRTDQDGYLDLARQARAAGLFHRSPVRALSRLSLVALAYGAGWAGLVLVGNSWYQLLVALYLAVVFAQVGFLGHDVGHHQVFRSRRWNDLIGWACADLGAGFSYGYWVDKHNRHHSRPNEVGADPDVGPGVIAWSPEQAAGKRSLGRAVARHQAALFFPLTCLEALSLHIASVRALPTKPVRHRLAEGLMMAGHALVYLFVVFWAMSPVRAVAFIAVQQGVFGLYLGSAFAPNHKGMPMPEPGQKLDFVRRQVTTSRNVKGSRLLDVAMGGLNYQIEHHLFPTMPMANLRRCQRMVRAYCATNEIDYCETTLARSYLISLRYLAKVGRAAA